MQNQAPKTACYSTAVYKEEVTPFDQFEYDYRTSIIRNPNGEVGTKMNNVEVPRQWSQINKIYLQNISVNRHSAAGWFIGPETSVKQVAHRMANCWKVWGEQYGYFASAKDAQGFMMSWFIVFLTRLACQTVRSGLILGFIQHTASPVNHKAIIMWMPSMVF